MTRLVRALLVAVCLAGIAAVVIARTRDRPSVQSAPAPAPLPARAEQPRTRADPGLTGVLFAHEQVIVSAKAPGRIVAVNVRLGDRVTRGQSLATLDAASLEQELAGARAALRAAEADGEKARVEVAQATDRRRRADKLADWSPRVEVADARFQLETALAHQSLARATVAGARAKVEQVAGTVHDAEIRAQFDGAVAERYLDAGATVAAGTPIVRVITADDLWVRFAVPETQAGTVVVGQPLAIDVPATGMRVTGKVQTIAPEIDPASRMLFVEGKVEIPEGARSRVASGLEARVRPGR